MLVSVMSIDLKKHLASVERVKTINDFEVRFTDTEGRKVLALVECSYGAEAVTDTDEEWDVAYIEVDGKPGRESFLNPEDKNEIIEFVKEFERRG